MILGGGNRGGRTILRGGGYRRVKGAIVEGEKEETTRADLPVLVENACSFASEG